MTNENDRQRLMEVKQVMRNGVRHRNRGENYSKVLTRSGLHKTVRVSLSLSLSLSHRPPQPPIMLYCRLTFVNEMQQEFD